MRACTEKMVNRLLDEAFMGYTLKRFISDEEITDFKTEFIQVFKNNCFKDRLETAEIEGEENLVHLTFGLRDNE